MHPLLLKASVLETIQNKHANVLQHIMGYFKRDLSSAEKQKAHERLRGDKQGVVPLIVPVTLRNHLGCKFKQKHLQELVGTGESEPASAGAQTTQPRVRWAPEICTPAYLR